MRKPIVILGCTASGKSELAEGLALRLGASNGGSPLRVMAVDSMQVYRGMDIGTAKPPVEIRKQIPYFMIDIADAWEAYSAARFVTEARPLLELSAKCETHNSKLGHGPLILVAGTILYLRSLVEGLFEGPSADEALRAELEERARIEGSFKLHAELGLADPAAAQRIHPNDLRRIIRALEVFRLTGTPISTLQTQWARAHPAVDAIYIGIRREKDALNRRINARVKKMLEAGLVEEVRRLSNDPRGFSEEAASGVGYRQLLDHFAGKCTLDEAIELIKIQTRYLAKMQRTWLKRWPAAGKVHWLDAVDETTSEQLIEQALAIVDAEGGCGGWLALQIGANRR